MIFRIQNVKPCLFLSKPRVQLYARPFVLRSSKYARLRRASELRRERRGTRRACSSGAVSRDIPVTSFASILNSVAARSFVHSHRSPRLDRETGHILHMPLAAALLCANAFTGMGQRVCPRLSESRIPTPSGHGARVHATEGPPYSPALYSLATCI